jgi:hypothetical protein
LPATSRASTGCGTTPSTVRTRLPW